MAPAPVDRLSPDSVKGMKFRNIGPAVASGRISDFAVNPNNHSEYYVAAAAGNVWKTVNAGITWTPVFDSYGAWSIADVEIDPNNTHVVWIGTGEYNSQRAIGYGDGVYRSEDGGKSWKNMGLQQSEHIGRIVIDPRNSHVYVAAQGPLWGPGGDRGLYKSTDNGKTWKPILTISENTGVTDVVFDPRNPDILYAASYQRRRHVYTVIDGGPECAIYKSTDAGATWTKLTSGLPSVDMGRIGLSISPVNPDIVYAIIEAQGDGGGFFRSTNRGATWEKRSDYSTLSAQYYNRIFADPKDPDKIYSMDTASKVSEDGGKTFRAIGNKNRHVDDHALWIDPGDTRHLLIGGDGGIYETFDAGEFWAFKANLPVTQFYRVSVDNSLPFYYVYGGTQDNSSMGGPSRTNRGDGIVNADWFFTQGGDGFFSRIDPENPDIVYAEAQYGYLTRYDRKSGENVEIKPREGKGEAYRWNWNAPLIISPHSHSRLYFAANFLFRSDDYGNSWKKVSGDLTRQLDRNQLPVMGKIQSPDAIAKSASTSLFGNIVSLSESPLTEGLLYVGTDDGLIQVTENGGHSWRKIDKFPGVPDMTYVSFLFTSLDKPDTVYAAFDNRKNSDFKPYLLKSTNRGKTWESIVSNLPQRGTVYCLAQDHVKKDLLFVGTEFGVFFTIDGGKKWTQLKGGLPTQAIYDMAIQKRENDLVLASFGRGFYILDNYAPLRELTPQILEGESHLFGVKNALQFVTTRKLYGQGQTLFRAPNPEYGATFTYYMKEPLKTLKEKRRDQEKKANEKGISIQYPTADQLRAEDEETAPYLLFTITHADGQVVRQIKTEPAVGLNRITWDLTYPRLKPAADSKPRSADEEDGETGVPVMPGNYTVSLSKYVNGVLTPLAGPQSFQVVTLNNATFPSKDGSGQSAFRTKAAELQREILGTAKLVKDQLQTMKQVRAALFNTPADIRRLINDAEVVETELREINRALEGDESIKKRNENQPPSINDRLSDLMESFQQSSGDPTPGMTELYTLCREEFAVQLDKLTKLMEGKVEKLKSDMESCGVPWTSTRIPTLK
ncbi:MAG: WD40/YVTN/BNR-like repeat-containing protein [Candidatus Omnitrophota bacterium]